MAKTKAKAENKAETKAKELVCIPIYKGKFGQTAPERKGK